MELRVDVVGGVNWGRSVRRGVGVSKEVAEAGFSGVRSVNDAGEEIIHDFVTGRVAWERCGAVVNVGEQGEREEFAKVVIVGESGGGGNIENVGAAFGDGRGELCEDGFKGFGDGERHEEFDELFAEGRLDPGGSMRGRGRSDEDVGDEKVTVDNCHVVHGDCSGGDLGVGARVSFEGHGG